MLDQFSRIKLDCENYFTKNYSIKVPEDWLIQCIEFFQEEKPVSLKKLYIYFKFKFIKKNRMNK